MSAILPHHGTTFTGVPMGRADAAVGNMVIGDLSRGPFLRFALLLFAAERQPSHSPAF
ncbi:MAG: hypothetical protein OJI67_20265 [Prosthecobacter sp.]|nr:hypothetical protein [Prosthecobacter sp.]